MDFPGDKLRQEISHPGDKWPSFPRTSSGLKINVFSLGALLRVLLEISLTTEVKQTSQPPSYALFDISGNWYMRGLHWAALRGPLPEQRGPCSAGAAGTWLPRERHSKVAQLLRKRSPSQRPFPGNTGLQCEKVPRLFLTACLGGVSRLTSVPCWTAVTRTTRMWTVHRWSIHLKCGHEWYDTYRGCKIRWLFNATVHQFTSLWIKFQISPDNNSHTKSSIHPGLVSTLWGKSRYSLIATACCPEGKYVSQ